VRKDKSDIYPCPRMIQMLENLWDTSYQL
jgi:hypothetical protein